MKNARHSVLTIGITGGIGTGKSEVCNIFAAHGARVLSADEVAKDLIAHDPSVAGRIRREFGDGVYDRAGKLVAKELAKIVFTDPTARERLEAIVHPPTLRAIRKQLDRLRASGEAPVVAVEAALLLEADAETMFDYIIVVDAPPALQIERVRNRDGASAFETEQRMAAQLPNEEKVKRADFVIRNDGDMAQLRRAAEFIWRLLSGMAAG
jgi:dephospho-CoA kinase